MFKFTYIKLKHIKYCFTFFLIIFLLSSCNAGAGNNTSPGEKNLAKSNQLSLSSSGYITEANNLASYYGNNELKLFFSELAPFISSDGTASQLKAINDSLNKIQNQLNTMQVSMDNIQKIVMAISEQQLETTFNTIDTQIQAITSINNQYKNVLNDLDIDAYMKLGESGSVVIHSALQDVRNLYVSSTALSESSIGSLLHQVAQNLNQQINSTPMNTDIIDRARKNNMILLGLGEQILVTLETARSLELATLYYNHHYAKDGELLILGESLGCMGSRYDSEDSYKSCVNKINTIFDQREKNVAAFINQQQETFDSLSISSSIVKLPRGSWSNSCSKDINNTQDFYFDGVVLQDSCYLSDGKRTFTMPIPVGICQNNIVENHNGYLSCQNYNDITNISGDFKIAKDEDDWHIFLKENETPITNDAISLITTGLFEEDLNGQKTFARNPHEKFGGRSVIFDAKTTRYFYIRYTPDSAIGGTYVTVGCIQGDPFCSVLPGSNEYAQIKFNQILNTQSSNVSYRIDGGGGPQEHQVGILHRVCRC